MVWYYPRQSSTTQETSRSVTDGAGMDCSLHSAVNFLAHLLLHQASVISRVGGSSSHVSAPVLRHRETPRDRHRPPPHARNTHHLHTPKSCCLSIHTRQPR